MPFAQGQGARLYFEETGTGHPIIFVHEFGADHREWEEQVRFFSREYRCIAFAARGYPPSDVPSDPALYGQDFAGADILAVLDHLGIARAHVVGLSMGAFATLLFGIRHPGRATALVVAGVGTGSNLAELNNFRAAQQERAAALRARGWGDMAEEAAHSPTRIQLKHKNPRGWGQYVAHLREHSAEGSAMTQAHYQGARDPVQAWEPALREMAVPTLLALGDEDEPCIEANIFLKRTLPNAGLWMHPRTGHAINLEEPAAFNQAVRDFFGTVERGRWKLGVSA